MAERHTIETYDRAPHNRNIWSTATERQTIETIHSHRAPNNRNNRHAWPILLFALRSPLYTTTPLPFGLCHEPMRINVASSRTLLHALNNRLQKYRILFFIRLCNYVILPIFVQLAFWQLKMYQVG